MFLESLILFIFLGYIDGVYSQNDLVLECHPFNKTDCEGNPKWEVVGIGTVLLNRVSTSDQYEAVEINGTYLFAIKIVNVTTEILERTFICSCINKIAEARPIDIDSMYIGSFIDF